MKNAEKIDYGARLTENQVMNYYKTLIIALLIFLLLHCADATASRLRRDVLEWQGAERSYFYYLPDKLIGKANAPLLLVLHGAGPSDGDEIAKSWGFVEEAEKQGVIAVFPNGVDSQWNDGRGVSFRRGDNSGIDDVGFLSAIIDHFIRSFGADASRVYMTGASNGGMMTLRMACERPDKLTAIAPMLASLPENTYKTCRPGKSLPVMMLNGTKDDIVPYDGGAVTLFGHEFGNVVPVDRTVDLWVTRNACDATPIVEPQEQYKPEEEVKSITTELYTNCASGKPIILYRLEGGKHSIPSLHRRKSWFTFDNEGDFEAAKEIMRFFSQYKK